jgi:hypothetical protein
VRPAAAQGLQDPPELHRLQDPQDLKGDDRLGWWSAPHRTGHHSAHPAFLEPATRRAAEGAPVFVVVTLIVEVTGPASVLSASVNMAVGPLQRVAAMA